MAQVTRPIAKNYFNTGDFPTEEQFANFIDSAVWYDELIPISRITMLESILNNLTQTGPLTGATDISVDVPIVADQLIREVVLWAAAPATITIRRNNDADTDEVVSIEAGERLVLLVSRWMTAGQVINLISPSMLINYRIYRTF